MMMWGDGEKKREIWGEKLKWQKMVFDGKPEEQGKEGIGRQNKLKEEKRIKKE